MVYLGINNIVTKYAEATRIKTLTKHGNSAALVIERPILDLLGAAADTAFEVVTDGKALILTPVKDATRPDIPVSVNRWKKSASTMQNPLRNLPSEA